MSSATWQYLLQQSITSPDQLVEWFPHMAPERETLKAVLSVSPMRINPYYAGVIRGAGLPVARQVIPDAAELHDTCGMEDPLAEDTHAPVACITHRYPDRVLFLVSNQCPVLCRFCTRKRKAGTPFPTHWPLLQDGIAYIRANPQIVDVLLSGGDPLLLEDEALGEILAALRAIPHVQTLRISTRVPAALPGRVTTALARVLGRFHPLFVNIHFNHPAEITPEACQACARLADRGIPLGSQTVLLRGVNDHPDTMRALMRGLLTMRVRPYYLHQMDCTRGTAHFRTRLSEGLAIIASLRGHISGMCIPHFVIDLPGGGGKVPLTPDYIVQRGPDALILKNYQGNLFRYPLLGS